MKCQLQNLRQYLGQKEKHEKYRHQQHLVQIGVSTPLLEDALHLYGAEGK